MATTITDVSFAEVADELLAAARQVEHDQRDDARKTLEQLDGRLRSLAESAKAMHAEASDGHADATEALAQAIQVDTDLFHLQNQLDNDVAVLDGQLTGKTDALAASRSELGRRASELKRKRSELAAAQAREDRLRDDSVGSIFLSIATFGLDRAVMAIANEIDGISGRISDLHSRVRVLNHRARTLSVEATEMERSIAQLRADSKKLENQRRLLGDRRRGAELLKNRYASLVEFLHSVDLFYRKLGVLLDGLDDRVDEIVDIVGFLDSPTQSISDLDDTGEYVGTLREALNDFDSLAESGPDGVNRQVVALRGLTVSAVSVTTGGWFEEVGVDGELGDWRECGADGQRVADFVEVGRDDWSVYLFDQPRGIYLALDLHRKKVGLRHSGEQFRDVYDIDHGCTILTCANPCQDLRR